MGIDYYVKLISHLSRQLLDSQTLNWGGDRGDRPPSETGLPPLRKTEIWKMFEIFK